MKSFWELPQQLLGYIVLKVTKAEPRFIYNDAVVYTWKRGGGVSLGRYIFLYKDADLTTVQHEYGHTLQSRKLGWLYLLIVGIPSAIWAGCFESIRQKKNISYYSFYTEKWADKLGGVERGT